MDDMGELLDEAKGPKVNWKRLFIFLALGVVPTAICFIFDWWWGGTAFLLLTLLAACFAFAPDLYPAIFTLYVVFAIAWLSGSLLDTVLPTEWDLSTESRIAISAIVGALLGIVIPIVFWFVVLFVSTKWIMSVSESFDVSWWQAFKFVATRVFDASQCNLVVENGKIAAEKPKGLLSKLGGPGVLVVHPGNVVVLERGGKVTRIEGPGVYRLKRFEYLKRPVKGEYIKGIVDLRPQWANGEASNVLTKDGIPLEFRVGMGFQIEPKSITDERPSSRFEGGEAHTKVLGTPEYPVYEATIRKAVFATTGGGWKALFPPGPINQLRDVVGAYTLDQIFPSNPSKAPNPDDRMIKSIEDEVSKRMDPSWAGVQLKSFDIIEVSMPADVRERMLRRWAIPVDRQVRIGVAEAERDAIIARSEGQARAFRAIEKIKAGARQDMVETVERLLDALDETKKEQVALSFVSVIQELTKRVGEDETATMRYIEAMQAIVQSPGIKSFIITPPTPSPGTFPSPPTPTQAQIALLEGRVKSEPENE